MHAGRCLRSGDRWRRSGRPWGIHLEVAHKLSEQTSWDRHKRRWEEVFEIFEVLVVAVAAIATAWTGYQAARVDGAQSVLYGRATRDLLGADAASTPDGQQPVADSAISNGWLQARGGGISGQYWTVSQPPIVVPLRDLAAIYGLPRPGRAQHPCAVPRLSGHPTQGDPIRTAGSPRRRLSAAATSKAGVPAAELCSMVSEPSG
jgi:hypothetical protein